MLGPAGYGATWLLLERIAEEWDGTTAPEFRLSIKEWRKTCGFSAKKLQDLLDILQNYEIIFAKFDESKLSLTAPILLKLLDEWTSRNRKNSGVTPEPLPSDSRIQIEQQSEIYKEQNKTHPPPANLRASLVRVLERHGIAPDSDRGRRIVRYVEQKQPNNPGGYLKTILQNKPDFDPSPVEPYESTQAAQRGYCAISASDALRKIGMLHEK